MICLQLWQPDKQQVQVLVEMGFTEAAVRSVLEAISGDEILAIKMLRFAKSAWAGNDTAAKVSFESLSSSSSLSLSFNSLPAMFLQAYLSSDVALSL